MPIGRDQRIPEQIIIDSPYLMVITERNLGTVLGMAFIASPNLSALEEDEDIAQWSPVPPQRQQQPPTGGKAIIVNGFPPDSPQWREVERLRTNLQGSPVDSTGNSRGQSSQNLGVRIGRVLPNTTATRLTNSATGRSVTLEAGDYLASINGQTVRAIGDATRIIAGLPRNSNVSIEIIDRRTSQRMILIGRLDVSPRQRLPCTFPMRI